MSHRSPDSYSPLRVLFWFELGFSQLIATVWTLTGLILWHWSNPAVTLRWNFLLGGILLGHGAYFISRGLGFLERVRRTAPNPLLWPVLYTYAALFLVIAGGLTVIFHPPLLFVLGFAALVLVTPYICAPLSVLTLHYCLGYDVKVLTAQIQSLLNTPSPRG